MEVDLTFFLIVSACRSVLLCRTFVDIWLRVLAVPEMIVMSDISIFEQGYLITCVRDEKQKQ
jgi:hypothetical protein